MFIASLANGQSFKGDSTPGKTWLDLPYVSITSVQLVLPLTIKKRLPDGSVKTYPPSTLTLAHYDAYYFMNEAIALAMHQGDEIVGVSEPEKVAEVVGAIDEELGIVTEVRMDNLGNVTHKTFSLEALHSRFIDPETRQGSFDQSIIRPGK